MAKTSRAGRAFSAATSLTSLFIFALAAHLVDAIWFKFGMEYAYYRLAIWVVVWFIGYGALKESGLDPRTLGFTLILSAISFAIPLITKYLNLVFPKDVGYGIVGLAPVWIVYILYFSGLDPESWLARIGIGYILLWIVVCIVWGIQMGYMNNLTSVQGDKIDVMSPIKSLYAMILKGWDEIVKGQTNVLNRSNSAMNTYFNDIKGESYTGKVDSNAKEKLGVYLEKIDKSQNEYYKDEPVTIWANIVARTFERPITIQVNCLSDRGTKDERKADKLTPVNRFEVLAYDENDLDCYFAKNTFEAGTHKFSFLVNFSFHTFAYQKFYLVDKTRAVSAMRDENKDILDIYGITDKKPIAIYTNGPVYIGMDVRPIPIKLDRKTENVFTLGVTIKNQWQGRIVNVTNLTLIFPPFAQLQNLNCEGMYEFEEIGKGAYRLKGTLGNIKDYKSLRCQLTVPGGNVLDALGETPISIHNFRVTADYIYEFEKSISITIKETEYVEKLKRATAATPPAFKKIPDIKIDKKQTGPEIMLQEYASDKETPKEMLQYRIVSQSKLDTAECIQKQPTTIECKSNDKDGISEITVEVSDLARTNTTKFKVIVGNVIDTGNNLANCNTQVTYCGVNQVYDLSKTCVSECIYYRGCFGIRSQWDCSCSEIECDSLGADCKKGYCPGNTQCCQKAAISAP